MKFNRTYEFQGSYSCHKAVLVILHFDNTFVHELKEQKIMYSVLHVVVLDSAGIR